jgi:hypothetical protein
MAGLARWGEAARSARLPQSFVLVERDLGVF